MEERQMLLEDFDMWLKTNFTDTFWLRGHRFQKMRNDYILVDGGRFTKEEARQLLMLITSSNPLERFNATIIIWERNGTLIKLLVILAPVVLILMYIYVKR